MHWLNLLHNPNKILIYNTLIMQWLVTLCSWVYRFVSNSECDTSIVKFVFYLTETFKRCQSIPRQKQIHLKKKHLQCNYQVSNVKRSRRFKDQNHQIQWKNYKVYAAHLYVLENSWFDSCRVLLIAYFLCNGAERGRVCSSCC